MHAKDKNSLQMFRRVRDLLRSGPVAPEVEKSLARFEASIERLTELAVQQEHQGRLTIAATQRSRLLVAQLRTELMDPIIRVGRTFLPTSGPEAEGIRAALVKRRASDYEGLMAAAEGMARLVAEHEAQFAEHGLPAGHAKRLTQAAGELRLAINARGLQQGKRTAATSGAREVTREALRQLRIVSSLVVP
nr:hypothetical protein [Gemmatimonadaceae bacterium]